MKKKMSSVIVTGLITAAVMLSACSNSSGGSNNADTMDLQERSDAAENLDPRIVQAENDFGLKLHRLLSEQDDGGNVILSPYSISTALAMAWNGSAGSTASEMSDALGWSGMDAKQVNEGNKLLARLLTDSSDGKIGRASCRERVL